MIYATTMSALWLLLLVGAQGTTIISIKYPPRGEEAIDATQQPAKRDLSLSYAATNIDSKEGTRVKTITVIKNVGGIGSGELGSSNAASNKQLKLAINPELHKNEEWANAFRDNFDSYGGLPEVPDIDDLFDFVNRKKPSSTTEKEATKETTKEPETTESGSTSTTTTTTATTSKTTATAPPTKATSEHAEEAEDSDEAIVEKIKGDAELLPHIKQANILRLQAQEHRRRQQQLQRQERLLHSGESFVNINYTTPTQSTGKFFENYVQVLPNGYDYGKPETPCAVAAPPNSIQVTTPSGRHYDIPQSNSSGTNGGINHPYLSPSVTKRTQIQPSPQPAQPTPSYSSVNSIVPPIVQPQQQQQQHQQGNVPQQVQPQSPPPLGGVGGGSGVSTSQRPYVAPSLRNNGLGINRGPPTPLPPPQPTYGVGNGNDNNNVNVNAVPSYRISGFGGGASRPNTFRSRGLKY